MKIIKLHEQVTIYTHDNGQWDNESTRQEYEPVYVNTDCIESMSQAGITRIRMVSGDVLSVFEGVEDIMLAIGKQIHEVSE